MKKIKMKKQNTIAAKIIALTQSKNDKYEYLTGKKINLLAQVK